MSFVAVAIVGGAVITGAMGTNASKSAAKTQANAANNAAQVSQNMFNTVNEQEQPFREAGYGAQSQLNYLLGIGPSGNPSSAPSGSPGPIGPYTNPAGQMPGSWLPAGPNGTPSTSQPVAGFNPHSLVGNSAFANPNASTGGGPNMQIPEASGGLTDQTGGPAATGSAAGGYGSLLTPFTAENFRQLSPAYQFQLQQGQQGVLNGTEGSQGALSGSAMKDLVDYNQGLASTSFNNAFNQYQTQQGNIYSRLSDIANRGQNAAANVGQQGTALAGSVAQSVTNAGTAQAAGQIGAANAWGSAVGNLSSLPWAMNTGSSASPWGSGPFGMPGG